MVKAAGVGTLGVAMALLWAPAAMAEPEVPADPTAPPAAVEPAPTGDPLAISAVPPTAPAADADADAELLSVTPADGVPHLATPDALPPGTTQQQTRNSSTRGYLKDVWEAVRSGDVTTGEALLLIAQRPMDSENVKQDMTPQQSMIPGAVPAPAAEALPPVPGAVPAAEAAVPAAEAAVPAAEAAVPAAEAAVPAAEAAVPAEVPLADPAPPLPFTLAP